MTTSTALLLAGWGTDLRRLEPISRHLADQGVDARVWPYRPAGTTASLSAQLVDAVTFLDATDRGPIHLVGHSFGGILAASAALEVPQLVTSVTTINAPWRGTWVSYTGASRLASELRWRSPALAQLRRRFAQHVAEPTGPSWLLMSVLGDLATPASTSLRAGGRGPRVTRRLVRAHGHSLSLLGPRVQASVADHVATASEPRPAAATKPVDRRWVRALTSGLMAPHDRPRTITDQAS